MVDTKLLNKLNTFVLTDAEKIAKKHHLSLQQVYAADNFAVASDGMRVAVIYNTEDHELNHTFGNDMDMAISFLKANKHSRYEKHQVTFIRKDLIDVLKEQIKFIKDKAKAEHKITIHSNEIHTRLNINPDTFKMEIYSITKYGYNKGNRCEDSYYKIRSENNTLEIDFFQDRYYIKENITIAFTTQFLLDFLNFFTGCRELTIYTDGDEQHEITCEVKDREQLLLPVRI